MAPDSAGKVVSLQLNPGHREAMRLVESALFVEGMGIEGDRHATDREERRGYQVLLIEAETLEGFSLDYGIVKENVTTSGIRLGALEGGQRLALGDEVMLEISKACAPCSRIEEIRPGMQAQLEGRRGMLASVVRGGTARVGDRIEAR